MVTESAGDARQEIRGDYLDYLGTDETYPVKTGSPAVLCASLMGVPPRSRGGLAALERLVTAKVLSNPNEMLARKETWGDAYRHTPHEKPVDLPNASRQLPLRPF